MPAIAVSATAATANVIDSLRIKSLLGWLGKRELMHERDRTATIRPILRDCQASAGLRPEAINTLNKAIATVKYDDRVYWFHAGSTSRPIVSPGEKRKSRQGVSGLEETPAE